VSRNYKIQKPSKIILYIFVKTVNNFFNNGKKSLYNKQQLYTKNISLVHKVNELSFLNYVPNKENKKRKGRIL